MASWKRTDLSVSPPSRQMADTDIQALTFSAGEAITAADADLYDLGAEESVDGVLDVQTGADNAIVTVGSLTRGHTYELAVTFTRVDTTAWTRTLIIECVA